MLNGIITALMHTVDNREGIWSIYTIQLACTDMVHPAQHYRVCVQFITVQIQVEPVQLRAPCICKVDKLYRDARTVFSHV